MTKIRKNDLLLLNEWGKLYSSSGDEIILKPGEEICNIPVIYSGQFNRPLLGFGVYNKDGEYTVVNKVLNNHVIITEYKSYYYTLENYIGDFLVGKNFNIEFITSAEVMTVEPVVFSQRAYFQAHNRGISFKVNNDIIYATNIQAYITYQDDKFSSSQFNGYGEEADFIVNIDGGKVKVFINEQLQEEKIIKIKKLVEQKIN